MNSNDKLYIDALEYHKADRPGKIGIVARKPHSSQRDLALAYSPGVAAPCQEITQDRSSAYKYTNKGNLVAVISNGTAVLGLGNIGAEASKPVMEGKSMLFKIFSGIDSFDIEVDTQNVDELITTIKNIAPSFGGINLEDIKAPECFEVEARLKELVDIPIMHDDQHGTAIITSAALLNYEKITGKRISELQVVINGAGAAAIASARMIVELGVKRENLVMCDSRGVVTAQRDDLNEQKREFATQRDITTLSDAVAHADVFMGMSKANVLSQDMVRAMADNPLVLALANPNPEISYDDAVASREDIIFGTGRSDLPNQVNNVLGFPYIFRGALDSRATCINAEMKLAAAHALAELAQEPVPQKVLDAYGLDSLEFGRGYLIPKPLDPRLLKKVSLAVAMAAMQSGVARKPIENIAEYEQFLDKLLY